MNKDHRYLIPLILLVCLLIGLTACDGNNTETPGEASESQSGGTSETGSESEMESGSDIDMETDDELLAGSETDTESNVESGSGSESESDIESDAESKSESESDTEPTHEHSFGEWVIETAPTCTAAGTEIRTCDCGESETRAFGEPTGHTEGDWIVDSPAQIGVTGQKHTECTICGMTMQTETMPSLIPSEGLQFISNGDGTCYVNGIGTCADSDVVIPNMSPEGIA